MRVHDKELFDSHCPYTDKICDSWECDTCAVEQAERQMLKDFEEATKEDFINLCKNLKDEINAQWEYVRYDPDYLTWSGTCTACHCKHESNEPVSKLSFCPHCGAKMNGEKKPELVVSGEDQK